jgi:pimeloyl-ACP methyl ester carboxylesterase
MQNDRGEPRHVEWRTLGPGGWHGLHATDWGRLRSKRVVVCAHGYSGNGRDFDWLARALASEARVICPDMAGRGESAWLPSAYAYNFPQLLSDTRAMLVKIGAPRVEWVGTSMGGLLGLLLASDSNSPISRLVLNDVGAFVPGDALREIAGNLRAPKRFASMASLTAHLKRTHGDWGPITGEQWAHLAHHHARGVDGGWALHYDPRIASIAYPPLFSPGLSLWNAWYRARCPALLVRGERSRIFPEQVLDQMLDAKPEAEHAQIADAGHAPSLMAPDQIALVADFLSRDAKRVRPARRSPATVAARAAGPSADSSARSR